MNNYPNIDKDDVMYDLFLKREFQLNKSYDIEMNDKAQIKLYRDSTCNKSNNIFSKMRDHQLLVTNYINPQTPFTGLLLFHGTGSGKCHGINTPIIMHDGSIKMVQRIKKNDLLMGDDGYPRRVLSVAQGFDTMYDVIQENGATYSVNKDHILCLKATGFPILRHSFLKKHFKVSFVKDNKFQSKVFTYSNLKEKQNTSFQAYSFLNDNQHDQIIEIPVADYIKLPGKEKKILMGYKVPVDFPNKPLLLDPYILGYWLGSRNHNLKIRCKNNNVYRYFSSSLFMHQLYLKYLGNDSYVISLVCHETFPTNTFLDVLLDHSLLESKYIPHIYKCNSRSKRLKMLAGLVDSCGDYEHGKYFISYSTRTKLINDIIYLCHSLGFVCNVSARSCWPRRSRIYISGSGLYQIPTLVYKNRVKKTSPKKDDLLTRITIKERRPSDFFGFLISGNNRYLLGDFTVTHNTCAAISIAETFKDQVEKYNTKIHVLVSGPILKKQFRNEIILSCTNSYIDKVEFSNSSSDRKKNLYMSGLNKVNKYYSILSYKSFYKRVLGEKIKKNFKEYKKRDGEIEREIGYNQIQNLDNSVLVVDEAHHFTGQNNEYGKALREILKKSVNLRIVLLTATPMQNLCSSIVDILNFLRPQSSQIKESDIFVGNDYTTTFKPGGQDLLAKYCKGYVSYFKGNDPYLFASRNDMGEKPPHLLFTKVIRCMMSKIQVDTYDEIDKKYSDVNDSLGRSYQTISNFVFPVIKNDNFVIGTISESDIIILKSLLTNNKTEYYKIVKKILPPNASVPFRINIEENLEISGSIFHRDYLPIFSPKFNRVFLNILKHNEGLTFCYSNFVKSGVNLFSKVLLENGFLEYNKNFSETMINDETLDYTLKIRYKDWKKKQKSKTAKKFLPAFFVSLTGTDNLPKNSPADEDEKVDIIFNVFNNEKNKNGESIKLIIGSKVINEGFTLHNIQNIHVLDTWYTLGLIDQVIGRGIRDCKHYNIMSDDNFYPKVNVFKYVSSLPGSKRISKDEEYYKKAELKYIEVKKVERILIENAIDCPLNYNMNIVKNKTYNKCSPIDKSTPKNTDKICPDVCQFQNCSFVCSSSILNNKYYDPKRKIYDTIPLKNIDNSTYFQHVMDIEIKKCIFEIKKMFIFNNRYTYDEIYDYVKNSYHVKKQYLFDSFYLQKALDKLTPINETDFIYFTDYVYNIYKQPGFLYYTKNVFEFKLFDETTNRFFDFTSEKLTVNSLLYNTKRKTSTKKKEEFNYEKTKYYYSGREENEYVGIILPDNVFNFRKKRNFKTKFREKGLTTELGGNCLTSFPKKVLIKIIKKYSSLKETDISKQKICSHIMNIFLHLEKTNKENKTYVILPFNHPIYVFPYNIYSRKKFLEAKFNKPVTMTSKYYEVKFDPKDDVSQFASLFKRYSFAQAEKNVWRANI